MSDYVTKGQIWASVRNGENATVESVKNFHDGGQAALVVKAKSGRRTWLSIGRHGINGYRLIPATPSHLGTCRMIGCVAGELCGAQVVP